MANGKKKCYFCENKIKHVDYKDVEVLKNFLSNHAKIEPRKRSGLCAKHQRKLATAVKRARHIAILPFVKENLR